MRVPRRRLLVPVLLGLLLLPSVSPLLSLPVQPLDEPTIGAEQYQGACRYNTQAWIYVSIHGDPTQRGYQYGYLLSAEIVDTLQRWANVIHNYPHLSRISQHLSPSRYERMSQTWWEYCTREISRLYWGKFPVEYQEEITAIATGVSGRGGRIFGREVMAADILTINEMYEFMSKMENVPKKIHPFKTLFHQLRDILPEMEHLTDSMLLDAFLSQEPADHCNGFIATGNATSQGQLVFAHGTIAGGGMWWWNYYIALRWNVILDVTPSEGHRFLMTTSPGYIWSDEDYYQSESGIVLLETTVPQGYYDNLGLPLSVRVRTAIQYANSIDDVIYDLRHRNDGCMDAVWLIGDTKTGEIARLDLGYRHAGIWRTYNGFFWSSNNPMDFGVRLEKFHLKKYVKFFLGSLLGYSGFGYWTFRYHPEERDRAYEAAGMANYGHLDTEIVKSIMLSPPISNWITDSKVTDSEMITHNGLWAHYGNPQRSLVMTVFDQPQTSTEVVDKAGWALVYGRPQSTNATALPMAIHPQNSTSVLWSSFLANQTNVTRGASANGILYWTTPSGMVYAMNASTGTVLWRRAVGGAPIAPLATLDGLYVGHEQGLSFLSNAGSVVWMSPMPGAITSMPVKIGSRIVVGDSSGNITAVDASTGVPQARAQLPGSALVGSGSGDIVYAVSGMSCYAMNLTNNRVLWTFPTGGPITVPPVEDRGLVYVASWDCRLYAVNASTGAVAWSFGTGWGFNAPVRLAGDRIYLAGMDNTLYVLSRDGAEVWNVTTTASIQSAPVVYGTVVLIASDDGHLYAVDRETGVPVWWFTPSKSIQGVKNYLTTPLQSSILVEDGCAFLGVNGTVYAVDAQTRCLW